MSEIVIIDELPVILTKDREFATQMTKRVMEPGAIIVLPADAVLVVKPRLEVAGASND